MKKFIVERDVRGLGGMSPGEFGILAGELNAALAMMPGIQWLHSYVSEDKTFCVFVAESETLVREHALETGFPIAKISEVVEVVDPTFEHLMSTSTKSTSRKSVIDWFSRARSRAA